MIRAIQTITVKDLRQRLRDKSFFLLGILTPLVLAFVLNLVFGGGNGEIEVKAGVINSDISEAADGVAAGLLAVDDEGGFQVDELASNADPESAIDDESFDAVVVIPDGFGDAVTAGRQPELQVVENPERPVQASIVASLADGVAADVDRTSLASAAARQLGIDPPNETSVEAVSVTQEFPGGEGLNVAARMLAGMAIMFVFFTVAFGVTNLLEEKKAGTLARLLAAPISRDSILASKALVAYVLGVVATLVLMIAATFLMGAEWGPWLGVVLLVLAAVVTAVALMAIVAAVAKTAEGAGGAQSIIAVGLAMLGGSWFPIADEGLMGFISRLTPHKWFLSGLEELAGATSWTAVVPNVIALLVMGVVAGIPAFFLLRRRLAP